MFSWEKNGEERCSVGKKNGVPKFKYQKNIQTINLLGGFPKHNEGGHGRDHPAY